MQLPLNVSPVSASVIGLQRLGILPVLLVACSSFVALGNIEVIVLHSVVKVQRLFMSAPILSHILRGLSTLFGANFVTMDKLAEMY
jgi:hypothetical protein